MARGSDPNIVTIERPRQPVSFALIAGLTALLTASTTFAAGWILLPEPAAPANVEVAAVDAVPHGFTTVDTQSTPHSVPKRPDDAVVTLASYSEDAAPTTVGDRAPWWISGTSPRVPLITQFDGGALASVNCTMAAGAMLARLTYGIKTTGTQLRLLQADREGGTGVAELNNAMRAGWGVRFARGWLTPVQLRALLWSGAGAVIHVTYGVIPASLRLQSTFTGAHSIYIDGFRRPGSAGPAAYYVMDPIGRAWRGYHGAWWPADVVERAALDFGGRRIVTAWGYAGGTAPRGPIRDLPDDAYPSSPSGGKRPHVDPPKPAEPDATPPAGVSVGPAPAVSGPTPSTPAELGPIGLQAITGAVSIRAILAACAAERPPGYCPPGIIGIYRPVVGPPEPPVVDGPPLVLQFADSPEPGFEEVVVRAPPGVTPELSAWTEAGGVAGDISRSSMDEAILNGEHVWIGAFPIANGSYHFLASSRDQSGVVSSDVASVTVTGG